MSHRQYMTHTNPKENYLAHDEIDLIQLVQQLWQKKLLITLITLIFFILTILYVSLQQPNYKSEITIIKNTDFAALKMIQQQFDQDNIITNTENINNNTISMSDLQAMLFNTTIQAIHNPKVRKQAMEESGLMQSYLKTMPKEISKEEKLDQAFFLLEQNLTVKTSNTDVVLEFVDSNQKIPQKFLNKWFMQAVEQHVGNFIVQEKELLHTNMQQNIYRHITYLEKQFIAKNRSEINELTKQLQIAKNANIVKPKIDNLNSISGLTFLLGTEILQERLTLAEQQLNRYQFLSIPGYSSDNKPLLPRVNTLNSLLSTLKTIDRAFDPILNLKLVQILDPANAPKNPEGPNNLIIIIIGLFLGVTFGCFCALILSSIQNRAANTLPMETISSNLKTV